MIATASILLVEDDPGDIRLAMAVLKKLQMEDRAKVVQDGEEAMEYLQARGDYAGRTSSLPSFILLDLKLPRVGGFEFLGKVKADPSLKYIPVVVLTSSRQTKDIELAYQMGANGYVVKSIDFTTYISTLRSVVQYWLSANEPPPIVTQCGSIPIPHAAPASQRLNQAMELLAGLAKWFAWRRTVRACFSRLLLRQRTYA